MPRGELTGQEILTKTQFEVRAEDFVLSRRQIIHGACGVVPDDLDGAVVSGEYSVLRARQGLAPEFLRHYANTPYFQRTCFHSSHGVDVEKMVFKLDRWLSWPVDIPPLAEQRKIAAILSDVDRVIDDARGVIVEIRNVAAAVVDDLLLREEWPTSPVEELGTVQGGRQLAPRDAPGQQRVYLRVANVMDSFIDTTSVKTMPLTDEDFARYRLDSGDVLLNEGQSTELVGRSAVYEGHPADCAFQNSLIRFRTGPRTTPEFAQALFEHLRRSGVFAKTSKQTTSIAHLGVNRFASLTVPVPPLSEQARVGRLWVAALARLATEEEHLRSLLTLKRSLAESLPAGVVRVSMGAEAA